MRFKRNPLRSPRILPALAAAAFLLCWSGEARGQFLVKWLAVGEMHHFYSEAGEHNEDYTSRHNLYWPGIRTEDGNVRGYALWIGATNFRDQNGKTWTYKVAHVGPRVTGAGEFFAEEFRMASKFDPPVTSVDGFETFLRPVLNDDVDPSLPADREVYSRTANVLGLTMERRVLAWSHPEHEDYHLNEYTFTNTGNVDDDEEVEIDNQTLEGVYIFFQNRYATNRSAGWVQDGAQGWGKWQMNDAVGDGHEDYDVDFRAQYSWLGNVTAGQRGYETTVGGPVWNGHDWLLPRADSLGRLGATNFVGKVYIHADAQAYPAETPVSARTNAADPLVVTDPDQIQPHTWRMMWTGHETTHVNDHLDEGANGKEYRFMAGEDLVTDPANTGTPRQYPHHADLVLASDRVKATREDFAEHEGDPTLGLGADGFAFSEAFGPYTIPPGHTIKLVIAEAAAGLGDRAEFKLGREYKLVAKGDDEYLMAYDADADGTIDPARERLNKNLWVMASKDSLFEVFQRAIDNYRSGFANAQAPLPPARFDVTSGADKITLEWEAYAGASPKHWELWRAQGRFDGLPIDGGLTTDKAYETNQFVYKCVAGCPGTTDLPASATRFEDTSVQRGLDYFYYLQAVADVGGQEMRSNRYYAQTYQAANLKRAPGASLSDARIVPNPYNIQTVSATRWSQRDELGFLDIPGNATIRIFSEIGELVKTIRHEDGTGDAFWDMQTESQQLVVTGIYIAAITDEDTGDTIYKKFVIVR